MYKYTEPSLPPPRKKQQQEALALLDAIEATLMDPRLDPLTPVSLLLFGGAVTLYRGAFCVGGGWGGCLILFLFFDPIQSSESEAKAALKSHIHIHTYTSVGQFGGEVKLPFVLRAHQLDAAVSGANSVCILILGAHWVVVCV